MLKSICLLSIFILITASCHRDKDIFETITRNEFMPEIIIETSGSVLGYVYDEQGNPVQGASVISYSATTVTDKHGLYIFSNIKMDKLGNYIKVIKSGYMHGSDVVYPGDDRGLHYSKIKLIALSGASKFQSSDGGQILIDGGGKLVFPKDAISLADNEPYDGEVLIRAKFIDPGSITFSDEMPGDLYGIDSSGRNVVLGSAGMMAVDLRTPQGQKLQLKQGKRAYFELPVGAESAPSNIPLWYFNEAKGVWIEEGRATLSGGFYSGEVSHFSFWNCDVPFQLINVCGRLVDNQGNPLKFVSLKVEADGLGVTYGSTNSNGFFCGKMPKNKILKLTLNRFICGPDPDFETTLGPLSTDTTLNSFIIDAPNTLSLEGQVTCNALGIEEAIIVINTPTGFFHTLSGNDGFFNINQWYFCGSSLEVEIFAYNPETNEASITETLILPNQGTITLNTCPVNCNLEAEFVEDCSYNVSISASGGSGNYGYLWDTGMTTNEITFTRFSQKRVYCVTVTDLDQPSCQQAFCYNYGGRLRIENTVGCGEPFAPIFTGGVAPFSFIWHDGSSNPFINLTDGQSYCVTITDAVGCSTESCGDFITLFLDNDISNCNKDRFYINFSFYDEANLEIPGEPTLKEVDLFNMSVFNTGFDFRIYIYLDFCFEQEIYSLPYFSGLDITGVENTSCAGCSDGSIGISVNAAAPCRSCIPGQLSIFNVSDLSTNLVNTNTAKMMPSGDYFVVIEDSNTACYIAFERVSIN